MPIGKRGVSTGVFDRSGYDGISAHGFYGVLGISLIWGLIATAAIAHKMAEIHYVPGGWEILIIGFIIPIAGIYVAVSNDNPIISFIGYNMIVIPFGIILGPVVNRYSPNIIRNAFAVTAGITFLMALMGTIYPAFFSKLGAPLLFSLGCLILVRIAQIFIPALDLAIVDYIGAGIFSMYVGYDMYRANSVPKTVDNAIDISVDLYLDIVNLFLHILRIMGKSKD